MGMLYHQLAGEFSLGSMVLNEDRGTYEAYCNYNVDAGNLLITLYFADGKTLDGAAIAQWYA